MTHNQRQKLLNSLTLAPRRIARERHSGTDACVFCEKNIERGALYHDRGPHRRAHEQCVIQEARKVK